MSQVGSGRIGSGQEFFKSHGSGRVGRVKRFSNLPGRVGSVHDVFKMSRVRSGHDPRDTDHSRIGPADLVRGSVFLQTYSCLPEGRSRDPRVRNDTVLAASCLKASLVPILRTPRAYHTSSVWHNSTRQWRRRIHY